MSPYADGVSLNSRASSALPLTPGLSQLLFFGLSGLTFCSPCSVPSPVLVKKFSETSKAFMDIMAAQASSGSSSALRWVSLLIPESRECSQSMGPSFLGGGLGIPWVLRQSLLWSFPRIGESLNSFPEAGKTERLSDIFL